MATKIDSNQTGLRYAEEQTLKTLPGSPVWYPLEPNKYKDFGAKITTVTRAPINASRQRQKGTVTDLDATGGFGQDVTVSNIMRLLQGFLFASAREKPTTTPLNAAAIDLTGVTATTITAAAGLDAFKPQALVLCSNFGVASNNGLKLVTVAAAGVLTLDPVDIEAAPPATAKVETVGYQFAVSTVDIEITGGLPRIVRKSGAVDFTTLGLVPGEWIHVGGDTAGLTFVSNIGWARVNAVGTTYIELDKTDWTPQAEVGTGLTVQMFTGTVFKNEGDPDNIVRRTYQLERTLGEDADGTMSEYLVGAVPNELSLNLPQADKVTMDLDFVGLDIEQRSGDDDVKTGDRPNILVDDSFNTSSDFSRIKLAIVNPLSPIATALFAFATELSIKIANNVSANKALGVIGGFETTAGMFDVDGKMTAYFADVASVQAVRNNADVTLDVIMAKKNRALAIDIPLLTLGDGRLTVEKDKAIEIPLEMGAAASKFDHTILFSVFAYTPTLAE